MKTKTSKIRNTLLLLGVIAFLGTLTSCSPGKILSGKTKYTYYKKIKVNKNEETFSVVQAVEPNRNTFDTTINSIQTKIKSEADLTKDPELTDINSSSDNLLKYSDQNKAQKIFPIETKLNKAKRTSNEKLNRCFPSKSNTMEKKNQGDHIILKVLLAILILILVIVLVIAMFYLMIQAIGFTFTIGC